MTTNTRVQSLIDRASYRLEDYSRMKQAGLIPLDGEFFPGGVHYPPITMYPETTPEEFYGSYKMPEDGQLDVYVHIPFCKLRCVFCHYPSLYRQNGGEKDKYLDALEKELDYGLRALGVDKIKVRSILLGGGTPTDLSPEQLERFLKYFTARLDMSTMTQFNYDVDPSTVVGEEGIERLRIMRDYGVDRITLGIQSFDDMILQKMNRPHDNTVAFESIENCRNMGYKVNIEFIFGYPGQTVENWIDVMDKAIATDVPEIQLYRLKIIPYGDQHGTIERIRRIRPDELPPNEVAILQKQIAIDLLADAGYNENLRRVFTKTKADISHYALNQCCNLLPEIGFGLSAFSSLDDRFGINTPNFPEYYKAIDEGHLPLNRGIVRNQDEQARWATILPLKNSWIRKRVFKRATGLDINDVFRDKIEVLKDFGLVEEDERRVELTTLGTFFADEVVEQFSAKEHIPHPPEKYADGPLNPYNNLALLAV